VLSIKCESAHKVEVRSQIMLHFEDGGGIEGNDRWGNRGYDHVFYDGQLEFVRVKTFRNAQNLEIDDSFL